jgi:hypothetical protein
LTTFGERAAMKNTMLGGARVTLVLKSMLSWPARQSGVGVKGRAWTQVWVKGLPAGELVSYGRHTERGACGRERGKGLLLMSPQAIITIRLPGGAHVSLRSCWLVHRRKHIHVRVERAASSDHVLGRLGAQHHLSPDATSPSSARPR